MSRRDAVANEGRAGGQRQRRLGDEVGGIVLDPLAVGGDLAGGTRRSDEHAVASRPMHLLDHQLAQVIQHISAVLGVAERIGRHVGQDRLLAEIEADHLGHVDIDRFVVGDPGADGVGQGHAAAAVNRDQPRHAEGGLGMERQGIEKLVADPPVDHMHPLGASGRSHVDGVVLDEQVLALDQFDAHLIGKEDVLEVSAVVGTRRQQRDGRVGYAGGRHGAQVRQQQIRVVIDRRHLLGGEQLGKEAHHDVAVLEHVGDARRRAQIVLQHVELGLAGAHEIEAGDMDVDIARHVDAHHLGPELGIAEDDIGRDAPGADDFPRMIDVVKEGVDGAQALTGAAFDQAPFLA